MKKLITFIAVLLAFLTFTMPLSACSITIDFGTIFDNLFISCANKEQPQEPQEPQKPQEPIVASGEISFHFMMLGNEYAGDCVYIKAGENDILIDAGSRKGSAVYIKEYIDDYVTDGTLEYVIATHAHQDHIAGFAANVGIFDMYECEIIIDFPQTDSDSATYHTYVEKRDAEVQLGAKHYTALECYNNQNGAQREYSLAQSIEMEILYNYYYDHDRTEEGKKVDENDYSVCVQFSHGDKKFLFTGDLEADGEEKLAQYNSIGQVELYKAGHHGSKTSSSEVFLSAIKPKMCVVCCCAGSVEYTQTFANTFPTQDFINRIAPYTDKVYVPIMIDVVFDAEKDKYVNADTIQMLNGNVVVYSDEEKVDVVCSNNNTLLKDTDWFKNNRICPLAWQTPVAS